MPPHELLFHPVERYADAVSTRIHGIVAAASLSVFVGVIAGAFVPLTREIEATGYTTADLQEATSRSEVDTILNALDPVMDSVVLLSVFDYVFIVAGFFLFFSVHSIALGVLSSYGRLSLVPKVGMLLTICSRSLDAIENFWVILIYTNPEEYPTVLIPLANGTQSAKWTVVAVEYPTLGLAVVLALLVRFTPLLDEE